jgi:hypothetical protein
LRRGRSFQSSCRLSLWPIGRRALSLADRASARISEAERLGQRFSETQAAPRAQVVLKIVNGHAGADFEFEERRPAVGVDAEIDRENVAKVDEPGKAGAEIEDLRNRPPRPLVLVVAQIDYPRGEGGRPRGAEPAASPEVSRAPDKVSLSFIQEKPRRPRSRRP